MQNTEWLGLKLPEVDDPVHVSDINYNTQYIEDTMWSIAHLGYSDPKFADTPLNSLLAITNGNIEELSNIVYNYSYLSPLWDTDSDQYKILYDESESILSVCAYYTGLGQYVEDLQNLAEHSESLTSLAVGLDTYSDVSGIEEGTIRFNGYDIEAPSGKVYASELESIVDTSVGQNVVLTNDGDVLLTTAYWWDGPTVTDTGYLVHSYSLKEIITKICECLTWGLQ